MPPLEKFLILAPHNHADIIANRRFISLINFLRYITGGTIDLIERDCYKASVVKLVDTLDSKSGSFGSGGSSPPTGTNVTTNNEYFFLSLLVRH